MERFLGRNFLKWRTYPGSNRASNAEEKATLGRIGLWQEPPDAETDSTTYPRKAL